MTALPPIDDDDSDECPDCGFALADDLSGALVRTVRSQAYPCPSCLWAHGWAHGPHGGDWEVEADA